MKNNLVINDKDELYVHRVHLEKLLNAKSFIQNKGPDIPYFLKYNISKNGTRRFKARKTCYENAMIFSRLLDINNSISEYSKIYRPLYCAAFDKQRHNFDKIERFRNISKENMSLYSRLIREKPHYPTKNFLNLNNYVIHLKEIIKRQREDNPNINFATFHQFKKNILKDKKMKRSTSARMLRSAILNQNQNKYSNSSNLFFKYDKYKIINEKKNNLNRTSNSLISSNLPKKNLNRCQSAFFGRENFYFNNNY